MSATVDAERSALRVRRARVLTLVWLATAVFSSVLMPGVGVLRETRSLWVLLGTLGIVVFATAQAGVLYGAVTPGRSVAAARGWLVAFGAAAGLSLALVAPVAPGDWATWSWIGAAIVGTVPLLFSPVRAVAVAAVTACVGVGVALAMGGSPLQTLLIILGLGGGIALVNWSPVWLWSLVADAHAGRESSAALAVTEERLRFARDVHDLLGHRLSIIALKAELVSRTAVDRPDAAASEAAEIRRLAATALGEVRSAVSDSRRVDLGRELEALRGVLEASGVRCTVDAPDGATIDVPPKAAGVLAPVAREAVTNVMRHSRASRCGMSLRRAGDAIILTVENDGVGAGGDAAGSGLIGMRERLREAGGTLEVETNGREFVLRATIGVVG
ncbi:histidine kinase [Agromyces sp. NPDC049794]|uniref:sensor histidine kinase n=1 Tax=unclassified Agromyces TaxID=2639701 RepID=UPI0033E1E7B0